MVTNLYVYQAIAEEAQAESERLEKLARKPKADGEPGFVITYDPEQNSFKHSLIAIAFAGMFLEALFYITGIKRFGKLEYNKRYDHKLQYEGKIELFGLHDPELLAETKRFRMMRNELVHDKDVEISELDADAIYTAQDEAARAISFVKQVAERL